MPIYAYKCTSCGFSKDVLQKMSDTPLEICPSCGQSAFKKQLTAAGFQLKGSGWYVTDFKGSGSAPAPATQTAAEGAAAPATTPGAAASDAVKTPESPSAAAGSSTTAE